MIGTGAMTASYIASMALFVSALNGLSSQATARRGNWLGIAGMVIAIGATILGTVTDHYLEVGVAMVVGGTIGLVVAKRVQMTAMPELIAALHTFVGVAAVLVGYANFIDGGSNLTGVELTIHSVETFVGVLIGAVTCSGSVIAYAKLSGLMGGKPLVLPGRDFINLGLVLAVLGLGLAFVAQSAASGGLIPLMVMTGLALLLGLHMVLAIGGADMTVVISLLNSFSGWAAVATGFMLDNNLLIVTGALVGAGGAIMTTIMCRAMNRSFLSVMVGGFGTGGGAKTSATEVEQGEVTKISATETAAVLLKAKEVMIIPGYGMAVAKAQQEVAELTKTLLAKGINVRFAIHPVAGRMPGHMNVLLAEARVPYDNVFEMDEVNEDFPNVDVSLVIGANDIVNPSALDEPNSPIAGMPVLECWNGKLTIVLKRSMAPGYAGVQNPLFFKEHTRMLFGDAKDSVKAVLDAL